MVQRSEQEEVRFGKLAKARNEGFKFPNDVVVTMKATQLFSYFEGQEGSAAAVPGDVAPQYILAGRVVAVRQMGKALFAHIIDESGKFQVYARKNDIGDDSYAALVDGDIGDIIEIKGFPFVTKTGEPTIHLVSWRLLVKGLVPLPEKWHGLADIESRFRQRYVDLIANVEVREVFRKRAQIVSAIRSFFDGRGFLEVETPTLHQTAGGAVARPFHTHHHALGEDMFLRIALELPLKKLVVGGFERVYEIGRVFRNEGLSRKHNPEFTMLEFYESFATFTDAMRTTEALFLHLLDTVHGGARTLTWGEEEISFEPPFRVVSMRDSLKSIGGVEDSVDLDDVVALNKVAAAHNVHLADAEDWGRVVEALWGELVESKLRAPTFITHHPLSISPLARVNDEDRRVTDRFELIVAGMELANGFSELNDAVDQRARFEAQAARKASGDLECPEVEEDFLRAIEYGLPPTAGEGIGIDRLVMLFTNMPSIREVVLFPQMRRESMSQDSK